MAKHIVDFMRAGVVELVTLQIDFRTAHMFRQALGKVKRARAADIMCVEGGKLSVKRRIGLSFSIGFLKIEDKWHQGLGHKSTTEISKMAGFIRSRPERIERLLNGHCALVLPQSYPVRLASGLNKSFDPIRIFNAWRAFNARGYIDTLRA